MFRLINKFLYRFNNNNDIINVGIIGTGDISLIHIKNLKKLSNIYRIISVCSRTLEKAIIIAEKNDIPFATNNYIDIINDDKIDAIFILTRHNTHVEIALKGIKANKAIFLEKPLAINLVELKSIELPLKTFKKPFMVGFNRRYSSHIKYIKKLIDLRNNPIFAVYRQNDRNYINENWIRGPEGGGVIIGHFCHIIDLFNFLLGDDLVFIKGISVENNMDNYLGSDNFIIILKYTDGSIVNIVHTTFGSKLYPKDSLEIFYDDSVLEMSNYKNTKLYSLNGVKVKYNKIDKGYYNEIVEFAKAINENYNYSEHNKNIIDSTQILFDIQNQFNNNSYFSFDNLTSEM
jgi:predicted dehydrogenase|tara:strand:+ start:2444 stop:3481 length:1038 start_codon:yes stop_codon:yes gene_type:complete